MQLLQAWCPSLSSNSHGDRARKPSLQPTTNLGNKNNNSLGEETGRRAWSWSSSSPKDPGGAPASTSNCSQPPSSLQLVALEEGMAGEQELSPTTHVDQLRSGVSSLQEIVGHLVLLISSVHKGDLNNFQLEHVRERACSAKLSKGAKQEDPNTACRTTCRQTKEQMQLDQARLQEGQLRRDLQQEDKKQTIGHNNKSLGPACNRPEQPRNRQRRKTSTTTMEDLGRYRCRTFGGT